MLQRALHETILSFSYESRRQCPLMYRMGIHVGVWMEMVRAGPLYGQTMLVNTQSNAAFLCTAFAHLQARLGALSIAFHKHDLVS
jgi:hypothetical protein